MCGAYVMTLDQVQEFIALKFKMDNLTTAVMMSQCHRLCYHTECPFDEKEKAEEKKAEEKKARPEEVDPSVTCNCTVKKTEVAGVGIIYAQRECPIHGHLHGKTITKEQP